MPELSNLLRERLAVRAGGLVHPDPDLLAAFGERSLPAAERSQVAEHLSLCAQCREVLALAVAEQPQEQAVGQVAAAATSGKQNRRWRFWAMPGFGLAATAAAMVIIAGTFYLEVFRKSAAVPVAQQEVKPPAPAPTQPQQAENQTPAAQPLAGPEQRDRREARTPAPVVTARLAGRSAAPTKLSAPPVQAASAPATIQKRDYVNVTMFSSNAAYVEGGAPGASELPQAPIQQQPSPTLQALTRNNQSITTLADIPANAAETSKAGEKIGPVPSQHAGILEWPAKAAKFARLNKIAPAISSKTPPALTMGGSAFGKTLQKSSAEPLAQAAESGKNSAGGSLDQSFSFTAPAMARSLAGKYETANGVHWKIAGGKLLKSADSSRWQEAWADPAVPLTFVAARGADVWAGGANATLLHSSNGGASWEEMFRPDDSASGSVTGIELAGSSVRVKTSTGQVWLSQDSGKSWMRQNSQE